LNALRGKNETFFCCASFLAADYIEIICSFASKRAIKMPFLVTRNSILFVTGWLMLVDGSMFGLFIDRFGHYGKFKVFTGVN